MTFDQLNLHPALLRAVADEGYTTPTPIQEKAIPIVLAGRDLLGCAQTGTGKTAAFAIPMLQQLQQRTNQSGRKKGIRALIVTPTRELAIQIGESFSNYGKHTGLTNTVIFGGVTQSAQTKKLQQGIDILVATPGRLLDLHQQGFIRFDALEIFVLDEADRMLDMGFINDVRKLVRLIPKQRQTLLFSATMPPDIVSLAQSMLHNPQRVDITPQSTTAETINQSLYYVEKGDKGKLLVEVINQEDMDTVLVFTRTKHGADKVVRMLNQQRITAEAIHGNKSQNNRQRALTNFKEGKTRVLVATDIAARGIDVDGLAYVINYEIPNISETYVHRIGRTGRAGSSGKAFSFCMPEEVKDWRNIEKLIGMKIPVIEDHPYPCANPGVYREAPKAEKTGGRRNSSSPRPAQTANKSARPAGPKGANSNARKRSWNSRAR
jgi:ATP-dependent RNA helicase RhlE